MFFACVILVPASTVVYLPPSTLMHEFCYFAVLVDLIYFRFEVACLLC